MFFFMFMFLFLFLLWAAIIICNLMPSKRASQRGHWGWSVGLNEVCVSGHRPSWTISAVSGAVRGHGGLPRGWRSICRCNCFVEACLVLITSEWHGASGMSLCCTMLFVVRWFVAGPGPVCGPALGFLPAGFTDATLHCGPKEIKPGCPTGIVLHRTLRKGGFRCCTAQPANQSL